MPDSIPLAQRLLMAAALAGASAVGAAEVEGIRDLSMLNGLRLKANVVAVLRELVDQIRHEEPLAGTAGYDEGWADAYAQIANDVEALADSIEKGVE